MKPPVWIRMPILCKLLGVLFILYSVEGKSKENKRSLPIEVVLNPEIDRRSSLPVNRLVKDQIKAPPIELKIQSNDDADGGEVDLIIAATKEVRASEQTIDRYSPAFNAQFSNDDATSKSTAVPKTSRSWDTSNQDSLFYPSSQSADLFPYLTLRQVLQTPQPLMLGRNQFSPMQGFGLQTQFLPQVDPRLRTYNELPGMGVVMSQPIFTGSLSSNQQGLLNPPQMYGLQQGILSQLQFNNQNQPHGIGQQLHTVQNLPLNRYTLINATPPKKVDEQNESNYPLRHTHPKPFQSHNEPSQNLVSHVPQSIPDILGPNRQQLPLHNRPEYTLQRNHQSQNTPAQRNLYQQQQSPLPQQHEAHRNIAPPHHNYHPNQNSQHNQQVPHNQQLNQNPNFYPNPQQLNGLQHRPPPGIKVGQNVQPPLYRNQNPDHNRLNPVQDRYRPPLRDLNSRPLILNQNYPRQGLPQQTLSSNFPTYQNGHLPNREEDNRKYPAYHNSPDGPRHLPSDNVQQVLTSNRHHQTPGLIQQQSNFSPLQEGFSQRPPPYEEPSYEAPHRAAEVSGQDLTTDVHTQRGSYDSSEATPVPPKRRRKTKKRIPVKVKEEDLEGHSSHQYIIKIG